MSHTEQRKRLRAVFGGTKCLSPASVYAALSARVAESVGYEIGMLAGSVASNTTLAAPDLIVLTLTEFADQVRRIMRASKLSLIVDADHGYGNALNVMRTVEELEHAGVSAMSIEDTALPARFGQAEGADELISTAEMVGSTWDPVLFAERSQRWESAAPTDWVARAGLRSRRQPTRPGPAPGLVGAGAARAGAELFRVVALLARRAGRPGDARGRAASARVSAARLECA